MAGQPTKLTPKVFKAIVKSVRNGNYFSTACEAAGVSEKTGDEWLRRGEGKDDRKKTKLYAEFATEIRQAKAHAEEVMVSVLKKAAIGFTETTTTKEASGEDGELKVVTTKTVKKSDWRAGEAFLRRARRAKWGDNYDEGDDDNEPKIINLPAGGPWTADGNGNGGNGDG